MKRFSLPSLLAVVVAVLFTVSCSDQTTAPASSHSLVAPTGVATDLGKPPPPPVKVAITVTVESPGAAVFTGVYFSHGVLSEEGTPFETFDGTAWLRLDNKQPTPLGSSSANTRFKRQDDKLSGAGTLYFLEGAVTVAYTITSVEIFLPDPNSDCNLPGQFCAFIKFTAKDRFGVDHQGQGTAFNVDGCDFIPPDGSGTGYFSCPEGSGS